MNHQLPAPRATGPDPGRDRHAARAWSVLAGLLGLLGLLLVAVPHAAAQEPPPAPPPPEEPAPPPPEEPAPAPPPDATVLDTTVGPDDLLVSLREGGEVAAVAPDGATRTLVRGLATPRGIVVLDDGAVLVAERDASRVVGFGGRYGDEVEVVVEYPSPEALVLAPEGFVVTSLLEGRVSSVEMDGAIVTDLATGLALPAGVLVRPDGVFVVEMDAQRVVRLDDDGPQPVVGGFELPLGIAAGVDDVFYVADAGTGEVIEVDGPSREVVGVLDSPAQMQAVGPNTVDDPPVLLLVATAAGLVELDPTTGEERSVAAPVAEVDPPGPGDEPPVPGLAGVVSAQPPPRPMDTATPQDPAASPGDDAASDPGADPDAAAPVAEEADAAWSSVLWVVVLALAIAAAVVAVFWVHVRRANATEDEDDSIAGAYDEVSGLHETFGPCLSQEVELEQAEVVQARAEAASETTREHLTRAQGRLDECEQELARHRGHAAPSSLPPADAEAQPIDQGELFLRTREGRVALEDYRAGRLNAGQLAQVWQQLGELAAIEQVRTAGRRASRAPVAAAPASVPGRATVAPVPPRPGHERSGRGEAERASEEELRDRRDRAAAMVVLVSEELARLDARVLRCREATDTARARLVACREGRPAPPPLSPPPPPPG